MVLGFGKLLLFLGELVVALKLFQEFGVGVVGGITLKTGLKAQRGGGWMGGLEREL